MTAPGPRVHGIVRAVLALGLTGFAVSFGYSLYSLLVHGQAFMRRRGWVDVDLSDPFQWGMAVFLALALIGCLGAVGYVLTGPLFRRARDV